MHIDFRKCQRCTGEKHILNVQTLSKTPGPEGNMFNRYNIQSSHPV